MQQLCDSHVWRAYHRDNTQVGIEVQPLRVDVVRYAVAVVVHHADDGDGIVTVLNSGIVVQPGEAKVRARLRTIVNVGVVGLEGVVVFLVEGKGSSMRISSKKCATRSVETAVLLALMKSLA